ncbi:unnamed protein product [Sphagnum troendelagicum]|uniref:LETM1-like protein n=1 Tax=Sphagnum troendelagicum TaxID=128251 RepID=A0ABP0TMW2_9BRYO
MHSAVCSSVSVTVARPSVEGGLFWGCCNARRAHHRHECQQLGVSRLEGGCSGFGKLKTKVEDEHNTTNNRPAMRKSMLERPRTCWTITRVAAAGESTYLGTSPETSEEEEGIVNMNDSFRRSENGWGADAQSTKFDGAMLNGGGGDQGKNLVHLLHETARMLQSAMEEQSTLTCGPWFAQKWLGIDKNAWLKSLAYQVAVHSLLQAVDEIVIRGEGQDRDTCIFVHHSLIRQSAPLRDSIKLQLSSRDPSAYDWLWLKQHPQAVANFVGFLEKDNWFTAVTFIGWEGASVGPSKGSDMALLMLALSNSAVVMKLGSAAVSCPLFSSSLMEEIKRLMQKLPEFMSMDQVYTFSSSVGLKQEFLEIFGLRAADDQNWQESGREGVFWVNLVHQLLWAALSREGFVSKLKAFDSIEVLEMDLAVFGFFAALGSSTSAYLAAKGVRDAEESLSSLLSYLEGGSVLYYPQLASVSTYQLFIEVVCEEMEWLPFYPGSPQSAAHGEHGNVMGMVGKVEKQAGIIVALQVCSMWVDSFLQQSTWVQQPQGILSATFLQKSKQRLDECYRVYNIVKREANCDGASEERLSDSVGLQEMECQLKLFDKELQSVECAMMKLEFLVKESEASSVACGREKLSAACSDLEKIRSLKREVEALESSLKFKAGLKEKLHENELRLPQRSSAFEGGIVGESQDYNQGVENRYGPKRFLSDMRLEQCKPSLFLVFPCSFPFLSFFVSLFGLCSTVSVEAETFEMLRSELAALESQVRQCAGQAGVDRVDKEVPSSSLSTKLEVHFDTELARAYGDIFCKSMEKLKDASTDAWRGTKLLGTDVGVAMVLLRRAVLGQKLTDREEKILRRTLMDLASVIPIGFLMLLPVTAVGHAAILAGIQKYVPALIPSAYGPKRLDVLRRLEQVQHLEPETAMSTIPLPRKIK